MQKYLLLPLALLAAACASKTPAVTKPIVIPQDYKPAEATRITSEGDTGEAYFSPDGAKLIYQSKKRSQHENSQIYIMDILTKKEKRITHNDGDDTCSYFSPDGKKIIYASTTDEIKERPKELKEESKAEEHKSGEKKKYEWKFLPYDIYQADVDGSHVKRLTKSPGYDAEAVYSSDGKKIIFTSIRSGDLELYTMTSNGNNLRKITNQKGYDGGAFFSPNGRKIVWRGFHDNKGNAQIYVASANGTQIKQITSAMGINWCPSWHPDGKKIIFSSNRDDRSNFELYLINADGTCLKRLTYSAGADILPVFSSDGKKIAFTSNRNGTNQVYMMDYVEPKDCLVEKP